MHTEMEQVCSGCNPSENVGLMCYINFCKAQSDIHAPAVLQKLAIGSLVLNHQNQDLKHISIWWNFKRD